MHRLLRFVGASALLSIGVSPLTGCEGVDLAPTRGDARTSISLPYAERQQLRAGMRTYLENIEKITEALAMHQQTGVAENARASGMQSMQASLSDAMRLPPDFTMLALDTRQRFDALAQTAENGAAKAEVLARLREVLVNCNACHASYKLVPD